MATDGAFGFAGAFRFADIHTALMELAELCQGKMNSENSRRLWQRVDKWFKPKNDYDELPNSLCDKIKQLDTDWMFLLVSLGPVYKWIRPDVRELETIASVASDVARDLGIARDNYACEKKKSRKHLKFLEEKLSDCQNKTEELMAGIGETVETWSRGSLPVHIYSSRVEKICYELNESLQSVLESLQVIIKVNDVADGPLDKICALYDDIKFIQGFFGDVSNYYASYKCDCYYDGIEHFLIRIASVVVCTGICSFKFWIHKKIDPSVAQIILVAGLERSQHQIVKLDLQFIRNVYDFSNIPSGDSCHNLAEEVKSLVALFIIHTPRTNNDQIRESFFAEINAVLVDAAFLSGPETDHLPFSELLVKICLLKVELFLMVHFDEEPSASTLSKEIEEVDEFVEKLRRFSEDLLQEKIDYGKQTLALIQEIASLYHSRYSLDISSLEVKNSIPRLFYKLVIFKAESFLMDLLMSNTTKMAYGNDQIESLLEELRFFKEFLTNQLMNNAKNFEEIFQQIEAVARGITFFSYSFSPKNITEVTIEKMIISFAEFLDQLKHIKAKLRQICPQVPMSNIPKTCKLLFIEFLIRNIGELLKSDPMSIGPVKHHITEIQQHLESLKSFLVKVSELDIEHPELKDVGNDVMLVAYKVDYVIDLIEFGADWQNLFRLIDILQELRFVNKQASKLQMTTLNSKVKNDIQVSFNRTSCGSTREAITETTLDLRDQEEVIIGRLTRGTSKRDIISIVGMPGIGKTTLARQVYGSQHVMYHFHRRAWCTVSQVYDKRELLLEILSDIHGLTDADEILGMNNADLEEKLRRCLLRNKYLIVMDDVWDIGAWNDLQISFPDDSNGSRIMITTRLSDVASEIMPNNDPHHLRPFSDDESWQLLEVKIFEGECCPEELLVLGKEIALQCKGLPLAVVAISGLLKRTEKSKDWWEKIVENLSSQIMNDPEDRCMEILELSYKHLPEYLKACFLYLGAFIEEKDIPVTKLIRFWLAEGFIRKTDSRSLELVAEDHLMDLINRSLVIISKRRSNGKVKACRLHDLIRDFCQSKAKEDNFFKLITKSDEPYASFPRSDYGFEFVYGYKFDPVTYVAYRSSIFLRRDHFVDSRPSSIGTRSLIFFASADSEPRCPYDISFICQNFKFLRVLDLECINMGISFPAEIGLLVQLRYLAVSGYLRDVPRSIANLWKLETLVVKGFRDMVILPDTVWRMSNLRHLHVNQYATFNLQDEEVGSSFQLENLVSFSCPALSCGEETEKILNRFPNLCKLRCMFLGDYSKNCTLFLRLNFLHLLESLKIFYFGKALNPSEFILPLSLKKLTLSHFHLLWCHISAIGRLPNLKVLKLDSGGFEGRSWEMRDEEFQELKFLKLDNLDIAEWNASSDHLPKLEQLVLRNCKDLQEIPCDFAEISTLEMIEVHWCRQSAEQSAKVMGEANEEIKVLISHS